MVRAKVQAHDDFENRPDASHIFDRISAARAAKATAKAETGAQRTATTRDEGAAKTGTDAMKEHGIMFRAFQISPDIYWVGAIEWNERYIHGFSMPHGSTTNAYLIMDEQITLIDTCMASFEGELLDRVADVVDPAKIDIIISNHSEKDHAGGLARVLEAAPHAKIVTSDPKGLAILKTYVGEEREFLPMKSGEDLCIGSRTLRFIHTPMVHWPDNMVTYSELDRILFSNDAFGQFFATSQRFADEVDPCTLMGCAKKYFANIIMPFAKQTAKAVAAVRQLNLRMIAPAHGLIWRGEEVERILSAYEKWCELQPDGSAVVVYATMYGSTARMAQVIAEAFMAAGVSVRLYDLDVSDISDIMTHVMDAEYVAVGSSTHNGTVLPPMGQFLTYLKGLAPKGRTGIAFGSYGWMAAAPKEIAAVMAAAGFQMPLEPQASDWDESTINEDALFQAVFALAQQG